MEASSAYGLVGRNDWRHRLDGCNGLIHRDDVIGPERMKVTGFAATLLEVQERLRLSTRQGQGCSSLLQPSCERDMSSATTSDIITVSLLET